MKHLLFTIMLCCFTSAQRVLAEPPIGAERKKVIEQEMHIGAERKSMGAQETPKANPLTSPTALVFYIFLIPIVVSYGFQGYHYLKNSRKRMKEVPAVILIDCPGNINDACLQHIYAAADLAVVPTRYDFDNLDATVLFSEMFIKISKAKMFFVPNGINAIEERREEIQKARNIAKKMLEKYGTVTARIKQCVTVKCYSTIFLMTLTSAMR